MKLTNNEEGKRENGKQRKGKKNTKMGNLWERKVELCIKRKHKKYIDRKEGKNIWIKKKDRNIMCVILCLVITSVFSIYSRLRTFFYVFFLSLSPNMLKILFSVIVGKVQWT